MKARDMSESAGVVRGHIPGGHRAEPVLIARKHGHSLCDLNHYFASRLASSFNGMYISQSKQGGTAHRLDERPAIRARR